MSINPGSDIVADVMKAADPARAQQVAARLDALSSMAPPNPSEFNTALLSAGASGSASFNRYSAGAQMTPGASTAKDEKAKTAFEATIIDSFVKEMLPKNASDVYGGGQAGDLWRTMLSEQISGQIAKTGRLGLAKKLFATHGIHSHDKSVSPNSHTKAPASEAVQASSNSLSLSSSATVIDGAVLEPKVNS